MIRQGRKVTRSDLTICDWKNLLKTPIQKLSTVLVTRYTDSSLRIQDFERLCTGLSSFVGKTPGLGADGIVDAMSNFMEQRGFTPWFGPACCAHVALVMM